MGRERVEEAEKGSKKGGGEVVEDKTKGGIGHKEERETESKDENVESKEEEMGHRQETE